MEKLEGELPRMMSISCLPEEVLELIASQLVLTFHDVVAFSSTSRRIRTATKFLTAQPLCIKDTDGTEKLYHELSNTTLGLVRSAIIDVNFTVAKSQDHSEQLRELLSRTPRLRYLSVRRPAPDPLDFTPRYEPSRSKTAIHPFPLRSSHFQPLNATYLANLTHLDLSGISIHPFLFTRFPRLTHIKLSLVNQRDAYLATDALNIIAAAKGCRLIGFEIGLHVGIQPHERLNVVKACITAWPSLETLNLFSTHGGKVPSLFDRWQRPETLISSATELAKAIELAPRLERLSLGLIPLDAESLSITPSLTPEIVSAPPGSLSTLAPIFRATCPSLKLFRCLVPLATRPGGKMVFPEFYEVARARWSGAESGWECTRENVGEGSTEMFGMLGRT
ncbi:hypothetical protein FRC12_003995 [Ceratobasidium sp. 428]|nr:hypothetical protein FRC12_003995 [Ceratobasidium sp. 428]